MLGIAAGGAVGAATRDPQAGASVAGIGSALGSAAGGALGAQYHGADPKTQTRAAIGGFLFPGIGATAGAWNPTFSSGHAMIGGRHNARDAARHRSFYMRHTAHGVQKVKYTYHDK